MGLGPGGLGNKSLGPGLDNYCLDIRRYYSKPLYNKRYKHNFFRISSAELRAESAERGATRLQGEADTLQGGLLQEKQRAKRMEDDMQGLVYSLENI